jgi:EF-P beta-lysylation protein EpmB
MRDSIQYSEQNFSTGQNWQKILAEGFSTASELLAFLQLPAEADSVLAEKQFKTRVPVGFARRMQPGDRFDPLLLQVLAVNEEMQMTPGYVADPLDETTTNTIPGLIHKYHGRVLLTVTGACAINCRYCFRRHFPYQENNPGRAGWQPVLDYIAKDERIHEVILSGGDPLLANETILASLIQSLEGISHLTTLRIHSRIPVVLPERVNDDLLALLQSSRLQKVMVLHVNHARELDDSVAEACHKLKQAGCHILNQSVLLAGVNDQADTLVELSERLFSLGVLPYYLHLLDKVQGAAHFDVPLERALSIFGQIQRQLPGYLVPRLAREEAGKANKTLIFPG